MANSTDSADTMGKKDIERTLAQAQAGSGVQGTQRQRAADGTGSLAYKFFKVRHPEYHGFHWRKLRALYRGGQSLLGDDDLMSLIFPKHRSEHGKVYDERRNRAVYINYAGEIIDHIVALLMSQPIDMTTDAEGAKAWPDYYDDLFKDVSPAGGRKTSLNTFLRDQILASLQLRRTWTLVDLPPMPVNIETGKPVEMASRADEDKAGLLDAYLLQIDPEMVIDWEVDATGEVEWALIETVEQKRHGVADDRGTVTKRWLLVDRASWRRYEISYKKDVPPQDTDPVGLIGEGTHPFKRTPLVPLELPDGLWAMSKLETPACEHFNKRSALSWAEFQSLFQELYEYLGAEEAGDPSTAIGNAQEDTGRGTNQSRGQGYVQVRGGDDKAEFVGPSTEPFAHALNSCKELRDEMHRVTHQMALTVDNSGAALRRSADSKAQDRAATKVILQALGKICREHIEAVVNMIADLRTDIGENEWSAQGMEKFEQADVTQSVEEAVLLETVPIPSPTFQRRHKFALAKLVLGDDATEEDLEAIEKEIGDNVTDEEFEAIDEEAEEAAAAAEAERLAKEAEAGGGAPTPEPGKPPAQPGKRPSKKPGARSPGMA